LGQDMSTTSDAIARHRAEFASLSEEELLAITWQDAANPPRALAAKQELEARSERAEIARHKEALGAASHANTLSKWAIVIAIGALIVSVVQTFWH